MDIHTGLLNYHFISEIFEELKASEMFSTIKTKYLLHKCLIKKFGMVLPQKVKVGSSHCWVSLLDLMEVDDNAVLVSFLPSLQNLLNNSQIQKNIEYPRIGKNRLLKTISDESFYKNDELVEKIINILWQ